MKTARGRKNSSTRWLQRQLNDPYVRDAQRLGYKSRAAFKLKELDDQLGLIKPGTIAVDLGAAPGGWCQILKEKQAKHIVAIDLIEVTDIPDISFVQMDFTEDDAPEVLINLLDGNRPNLVLSDMAPNTVGHPKTDHLRTMALVEMAWDFALNTLENGGHLIFTANNFQYKKDRTVYHKEVLTSLLPSNITYKTIELSYIFLNRLNYKDNCFCGPIKLILVSLATQN